MSDQARSGSDDVNIFGLDSGKHAFALVKIRFGLAIVGEDGPHPFLGGELTEVWFENNDEYDTCFYLQHGQLGSRVLGDFEALCSFATQQLSVK